MKRILLPILGVIWSVFLTMNTSFAQQNGVIRCATMENDAELRTNNPNLGTLDDMEQMLAPIIAQKKLQAQNPNAHIVDGVYIIPIVVHVIHNGEAVGVGNNISYARIVSQIETLNDDFRRRVGTNGFNTHPSGADTKIEFRLAQRQPNGSAFAEIGVNRINRNTPGWGAIGGGYSTAFIDATIKPYTTTTQGYDGSVYMSFWCVPISGGILGYAQFPVTTLGGMSCTTQNTVTDGVVMGTSTVGGETTPSGAGPYNLGRTATHEIGHWLGLRHIWGDGNCTVDDFCADTPLANGANYGCATGNNSCTTTPIDFPDMVENYMDYSDDACMNIFTNDQKIRMRTILETTRFSLINSIAAVPPNPSDAGVLVVLSPISDVCSSTVTSSVRIKNYGSTTLTSVTVQYRIDAAAFTSQAFTGLNIAPSGTADLILNPLTGVTLGNHTFEARTILPNGVADPFTASDLSNSTFTFGTGALPIVADFEGADFPPPSWERQNPNDDCSLWIVDSPLTLRGADGNPTKAALVRHFSYSGTGQQDILITPSINLTIAGTTDVKLDFDVAYRRRNNASNENLRLEVSTDCGLTWNTVAPIYNKSGTILHTVTSTSTTEFIPISAAQWRRETVSLNTYLGQSIKVRFVTTNTNGNNLWIDNVRIYDTRPEVQFVATTNTITENSSSGTIDCRGYQDLTIPVSISAAPLTAVTVNVTATAGTMNAQDYVLQTPTLTFPIASTANQNVVVRVFNDNAVEVAENLQLTLSVVGTNAILGTNSVHTLTVNDNDDIAGFVTQTLFSENFQSYAAGAVTGGWTVTTKEAGNNNWVFGQNGGITGNRSAYISQNAGTRPLTYANTSISRTRLVSPAISTVGATNLQLSFNFKANGEVFTGNGRPYDFGRLMYSTNPAGPYTALTGGADANDDGDSGITDATPFVLNATTTAYTVTLPVACQNQAALYLVWRWDNDVSDGANPPFAIDDIVLTGSVLSQYPVENTLTSKIVSLGPNSTVYVISSNNKVMAKLENTTSHDYGCTTVAIDRVGTGQSAYTITGAANGLTQKSFRITPTNPSTQDIGVTLYYTNAEKTGWEAATGRSWTVDAKMQRTGGAISAIVPATPTANGATNSNHALTRSAYLTTEHAVKATITNGFGNSNASGGFAIGDPVQCLISAIAYVSQTACVAATNKYTATVTVTYSNPSGSLVVNGQTFATTTSPQTVTLTNLESDGLAVDVTAVFSGNAACTFTSTSSFTAPVACSFNGTVTLGAVTPTTYCAGTTISVPYTTSGTFGGTNVFTAQLSNSAGVFTTPIATASGVSPISLTIPAGATASATYKVRVISTVPSSISGEATITVNVSPTVTLSAFTGVCSTTASFALSGGLPAGGTYSGTGVSGGNFDPATAGAGTHTITYTVVNGGCSNTATQDIVVSAPTAPTLGVFTGVCSTTASFALSGGLPAGGTYTGTGVSGGNFNPATAGVGTHTITYTVVNGACTNTATQNIVVSAPTTVTLAAFTSVCSTQAVFALSGGLPAGGTYTGTGVSAGNFDPATAGVGTHTITYTVVNGACSNTATRTIVVSTPPVATLVMSNACLTPTHILNGGLPTGGTYSGTNVTGGTTFDAATAGIGTHTITYTVTIGTCTSSTNATITVVDCPASAVIPIAAPTSFTATSISPTQINLSWDAVSGATGYLLYVGNTLIGTITSGGITTFQHTGLNADTRYSYRLIATNGTNQSLASQTNGNTYPYAPVVLSNTATCGTGSVRLALSASGALYNIYVQETGGSPIAQTNIASYSTPAISQTTIYYISVIGIRGLESERTRVEAVVTPTFEASITEGRTVRSCDATTTLTANQVENATYTWLVNGAVIDNSNTATFAATRSGNYQVRITKGVCDISSASSAVVLNYTPLAEITNGSAAGFCENGTLRAREVANATYSWTRNNTVVGTTREVAVSESGQYTLTVTENGCLATDVIDVVITSLPSISVSTSSATLCPNEEVTLTADQISGVTYNWVRNGRVFRRNAQSSITVTTGGEYSVIISQNGCDVSSSSVNVERLDVAVAYLRTTPTTLFVESESTISNITWKVGDADDASLEGQNTVTPTESNYYSALITYSTGCSIRTRTAFFRYTPPVVLGEEEEFIKTLRIYPNPSASGIFQIDLGQNTETITLILSDQLGRILETIALPSDTNSYQLDLSKYASALYTIQFKSEKGVVTRKVVIDK